MNYIDALKVHEIVKEIELNNADICIFNDAINNGIEAAQITIQSKNGAYHSARYENDRIDVLMRVLYERNTELMTKLKEL